MERNIGLHQSRVNNFLNTSDAGAATEGRPYSCCSSGASNDVTRLTTTVGVALRGHPCVITQQLPLLLIKEHTRSRNPGG